MTKDELISRTYLELVARLNMRLNSQHYALVNDKNEDKVFASHYTVWSNNTDALKLLWDGKEELFVLTVTADLPLSHLSRWEDIVLVPFENFTLSESDLIIGIITAALD